MISKHPHIVVVGAGIVGASLAYHLTRANARVTLIDKASNSASGATEKSFAWITVAHDAPKTYITLRQQALADWHRVEDELKGQLKIDWSGALTWRADPAETERIVGKLIDAGYQVCLVDRPQIRRLEPNLKDVPPQAMLAEHEGAIDSRLTTEVLITAACQAGATIQLGNKVLSVMTNGSRVTGVVTAHGKIRADRVVLATGIHTALLCQPLHVTLPINVSPAILLAFHTPHPFVNRIISNPLLEIRAASATRILCAEDYVDESIENNPQAIAQRSLEKIKQQWQSIGSIRVMNVMVGKRPVPGDGLPVISRTTQIEGLYVLVMHAGTTLAAVVGRLAASELLSGQDEFLLSSYRLARFN